MERPTVQLCRTSPAKEFPPAISLRLAIALSKDLRGIRVTGLRSRIFSQLSNTDSVGPVGVCLEWQVRRALQGFWRRRFNFRPVAVFNAVQSTHPAEVRSNLTVVARSRARGPDPPDNGECPKPPGADPLSRPDQRPVRLGLSSAVTRAAEAAPYDRA